MTDEPRPKRSSTGCIIALVIVGGLCLACLGGVGLLGWSAWQNPSVRLGVRAGRAAMEMTQRAITAPGAAEVRAAGCDQAMVYSPALMSSFVAELALDGGRIVAPSVPMLVCGMRTGDGPTCAQVAAAYGEAVDASPEVIVYVWRGNGPEPRCSGVYRPDGALARDPDEDEVSFAQVTRPRAL